MDKQIEDLMALHYKCRDYLDVRDYEGYVRFLDFYITNQDINELNTILIISQGDFLKNHPIVGPALKQVQRRYNKLNKK